MRLSFRTFAAFWIAVLALCFAFAVRAEQPTPGPGVLSIGGSVTEIVYALGQGERLIARDTTSTYPAAAEDLPDVGYMRALSPEGVLAVAPDLVLSEAGAGPPEAIAVLREADIAFVTIPGGFDAAAIGAKIRAVGAALNVPDRAEALAAQVQAEIASATEQARQDAPKRVLFLLSAQGGKLMAGGSGTGADAIIRMAGGVNAAEGFPGYKTLTDEAAAAAAPDVILMMDRDGDHSASAETLFALPALAVTPAAQAGALIKMDGLKMLGFGPRTGAAVRELNAALYGG